MTASDLNQVLARSRGSLAPWDARRKAFRWLIDDERKPETFDDGLLKFLNACSIGASSLFSRVSKGTYLVAFVSLQQEVDDPRDRLLIDQVISKLSNESPDLETPEAQLYGVTDNLNTWCLIAVDNETRASLTEASVVVNELARRFMEERDTGKKKRSPEELVADFGALSIPEVVAFAEDLNSSFPKSANALRDAFREATQNGDGESPLSSLGELRVRLRDIARESGLTYSEIAELLGKEKGAIGRLLSEQQQRESTMSSVLAYLTALGYELRIRRIKKISEENT